MREIYLKRLFGAPVLWYKSQELRRFLAATKQVSSIQAQRLAQHLAHMDGSAFVQDHGIAGIRRADELQRALPIADYSRVEPYIQRVASGETEALFAASTRVLMLAQTSGTTAAVKQIPVTWESAQEYQQSWTVWGCALARQYKNAAFAASLSLASDWRPSLSPAGIPRGSISGLLSHLMERTLGPTNIMPSFAMKAGHADARLYLAARLALMRPDLMVISTANPNTLINFARLIDAHKETLLRDIYDGGLSDRTQHGEVGYDSEMRQQVDAKLRAKPAARRARVRDLEAVVERTGQLFPKDIWPLLSVLGVWTGGTMASYLQTLPTYYGRAALRDHGLSASEGRLSIPLHDHDSSGVLNIMGCYYEFIPEADYGSSQPRTYAAHELDVGARYYIVLTSSGGLVRYDLADLIECTGHVEQAPCIKFLRKSLQYANIVGEKLSSDQACAAMARVQAEMGIYIGEWSLVPVLADPLVGDLPCYHLLLEESIMHASDARGMLLARLDQWLSEFNIEYADKRRSRRLGLPVLTALPNGTFSHWRQCKLSTGVTAEQYKHPFLLADTSFLESFGVPPFTWERRARGA